ncbi:unnamed protein product [Boreogadus saida]
MNRSARHGSSATGRQQVWTGRSGSPVGDGKAGGPAAGGVQGGLSRGAQDGDAGPGPPQFHQVRSERLLEGVLRKYTNLLQGWQNRYFVLNQERSHLLYFLNESCRSQRPPRGSLPLLGASVVSCEEFPYMFTVSSINGDVYKLRASDAQEQRLWMTQLQLCSRRISDTNDKLCQQAYSLVSQPMDDHLGVWPLTGCFNEVTCCFFPGSPHLGSPPPGNTSKPQPQPPPPPTPPAAPFPLPPDHHHHHLHPRPELRPGGSPLRSLGTLSPHQTCRKVGCSWTLGWPFLGGLLEVREVGGTGLNPEQAWGSYHRLPLRQLESVGRVVCFQGLEWL